MFVYSTGIFFICIILYIVINYDFERIVAENKDVLGLIWLTKISVK